jgi:hypothetical protein
MRLVRIATQVRFLLALGLLACVVDNGYAEGRCPQGYFPIGVGNAGWEGCGPMSPNTDEGGADQGSTEPAPAGWETCWAP